MSNDNPSLLPGWISGSHILLAPALMLVSCGQPTTMCCFAWSWLLLFLPPMLARVREGEGSRVTRGTQAMWVASYLYWAVFIAFTLLGFEPPHSAYSDRDGFLLVFSAVLLLAAFTAFTSILALVCEGDVRHERAGLEVDLLAHYPVIRS